MPTITTRHVLLAGFLLLAAAAGHSRAPTLAADHAVAATPAAPTLLTIDAAPQAPFDETTITTMETVAASPRD